MLYRKRRRKRRSKLRRVLFSITISLVLLVVFCEVHLSDFRPEYIRTQAEILSTNSVSDAVNSTLEKLGYGYDDLTKISFDSSGSAKAIQTDSIKINKIKSSVTKAVQKEIAKVYDNEILIPLGAFTNITVLSNAGPCIPMNFTLTGSFSAEIVSTFEACSINQTIHHIRLLLTSKIMTTSLDYSGKITFTTDFEIAQSVIVGDIPNIYGGMYSLGTKN